jgi:hypothetical protein
MICTTPLFSEIILLYILGQRYELGLCGFRINKTQHFNRPLVAKFRNSNTICAKTGLRVQWIERAFPKR